MEIGVREEVVEFNRRQFFERLRALEPESILDVGCGGGDLLHRCQQEGLRARGVEPGGVPVTERVRPELDIEDASATRLPFADRSIDWVCMRYVPHHLEDPAAAFSEAMRVCVRGFFVAEPWFDVSLASQRNAVELDSWVKEQHRRGGMVHEEVLGSAQLIAALPTQYASPDSLHVEESLRLRQRTKENFEAEVLQYAGELPGGHADLARLEALRAAVESDGLSWNGSVYLTVRKSVGDE